MWTLPNPDPVPTVGAERIIDGILDDLSVKGKVLEIKGWDLVVSGMVINQEDSHLIFFSELPDDKKKLKTIKKILQKTLVIVDNKLDIKT